MFDHAASDRNAGGGGVGKIGTRDGYAGNRGGSTCVIPRIIH